MKWTEIKPPTKDISTYNHTICETPIGKFIIEWKGWKEEPSYCVTLDNNFIASEYTLEIAKEQSLNYLKNKSEELINFINPK